MPGWEQDIVPFLKSHEFQALSLIRKPSQRDRNITPDYWIGLQEGRLEMIESLRVFIYSSVTSFTEEQLKDEIESLI